ncbi:hypothetical protein ABID99_004511 [Mucilaginibacter sp. OAE612]
MLDMRFETLILSIFYLYFISLEIYNLLEETKI